MKNALLGAAIIISISSGATEFVRAENKTATTGEKELAADLALLQGSWEMLQGNEGKGEPTIRSVKTIEGKMETLRRYSIKTGKLTHEHSVEFQLSTSGSVHVFTFFAVGGSPDQGLSYVYKVDKDNFYDIPGLLHGDDYRNYQSQTRIWHWKRVPEKDANGPATNGDTKSEN